MKFEELPEWLQGPLVAFGLKREVYSGGYFQIECLLRNASAERLNYAEAVNKYAAQLNAIDAAKWAQTLIPSMMSSIPGMK